MLSILSASINAPKLLKTPSVSPTSLLSNPSSCRAFCLNKKDLVSYNFYSSITRSLRYHAARQNFVVGNNITPPGVPVSSGSPSGSLNNWVVGIVLAFILPFVTRKWGSLTLLKNKADMVIETTEHVMEAIEAVAKGADEIIDEITDGLPENSKLRENMKAFDEMVEEVAKGAHIANEIIAKVEETEEKLDSLIRDEVKKEAVSIRVLHVEEVSTQVLQEEEISSQEPNAIQKETSKILDSQIDKVNNS